MKSFFENIEKEFAKDIKQIEEECKREDEFKNFYKQELKKMTLSDKIKELYHLQMKEIKQDWTFSKKNKMTREEKLKLKVLVSDDDTLYYGIIFPMFFPIILMWYIIKTILQNLMIIRGDKEDENK